MIGGVHAASARATEAQLFRRTGDPRWQPLIAAAGDIQVEPAKPFADLQLLEEIGWRAVTACRPMRYFYASREARATRARIDADTRAFRAGALVPTRLYILVDGAPAPRAVKDRVQMFDGIRIIPPTRSAPRASCG